MNTLNFFLIICVYCSIVQGNYGKKFHSIPYHESSYSWDETRLVEKKVQYPKSNANDGLSRTAHLFRINSEMPKEFQQKLPPNEIKHHTASKLESTTYKTLEMKVGEYLIKVKSEKESKNLGSAPKEGIYDNFINPKFSHTIEIIHKGNLEKENKCSQIYNATVEKQTLQLTKSPNSETINVSEGADNSECVDLDSGEFEPKEEDSEKFETDEGDSEELLEPNEGGPKEFDETDEEVSEEFEEADEGGSEEFEEADEGGSEEFQEGSEEFEEADEGGPEEFEEADEGGPEQFEETDEGGPEQFEETDKVGPKESDEFGGYPVEFGETDKRDSEDFDKIERVSETVLPDATENTIEFVEEVNKDKNNGTGIEQIVDNTEKSTFNDEIEGSGEFSIGSDLNITKTGRILGLFSRQNATFPTCTTPKGEAGHCRRLSECLLGEAMNNFNGFLQQLCLIRGALVGICCPDNPVIETMNPDQNSTTELTAEEIKQPPEGCGLNTKTRIVGGTISVPHEWTWMVALLRRNRFYCGGVIINNWYILTAAHCVLGIDVKDLTVRLGEYDFNEQSKHIEDLSVSEIKRHSQFVTLTFQHDIALLKLKRSIKYSKFVGSICLPDEKARDYSDAKGTVVGWGTVSFGGAASPVLRQVTVPVWKNEDCDKTYLMERIGDSFMCAGSPEKGEDACQGDSGGPLMTVDEKGRWEVIGLVSWGRRCGDPTYPGVYTRVTTYLDWISQNAI